MKIATAMAVACLSAVGLAAAQDARAVVRNYDLNIPKQSLDMALRDLAQQTGLQIALFSDSIDSSAVVGPIAGNKSAEEALQTLLAPSGLSYKVVSEGTIAVLNPKSAPPAVSGRKEETTKKSSFDPFWISQATSPPPQEGDGGRRPREDRVDEGKALAPSSEETGGDKIQEILVTATRRDENVRDVPMSIAVIGNQDIERRSLTGMADYLRTVPGVSHLDFGVGRNAVVIRGISIDPANDGSSIGQSVGVYFGEIPLSSLRFSSADLKLVDMSRVEVLRGPQGTVYGAGSLSGAIRNIPVAPNLREFEGTVEAGYSETAGYGGGGNVLKAVVNLPLSEDKFAMRLVGYRFEESGFIRNIAADDTAFVANAALWGSEALAVNRGDVGQTEYIGGRVSALWQPTEPLSAALTFITQDATQEGIPEVEIYKGGAYTQTRLQLGDIAGGGPEMLRDETHVANLVISYGLPWATLVSSSSYSEQKWTYNRDIAFFIGGITAPQVHHADTEGFSQEVRLVSQLDGKFQFLAGVYFEDLEDFRPAATYFGGDPSRAPFGLDPLGDLLLFDYIERKDLQQTAVFGEFSYDVSRRIKLTLGARRFNYDRRNAVYYSAPAFGGAVIRTDLRMDEEGESYKANVTYKLGDDALLYAQWSQGFRFGRPLDAFFPSCDGNGDGIVDGSGGVPMFGAAIKSDQLDNYEAGGKLAMFDKRLVVNAAVHSIDWTGLPVAIFAPPPCGQVYTVNAGKARSQGIELESSLSLTRNLRLNVGGSLLSIELNGDAPGIGLDGDRLPGSPERQFNTGLEYLFKLSAFPSYVRADYSHVGSFYTRTGEQGAKVGGYELLSARIGVAINQVEVSLFGTNLTNSDALAWGSATGVGFQLKPRTIGMSAAMRF